MEVRHALAHHVVDRHEAPRYFEGLRHRTCEPPNAFEQRPDLVGTKFGQRHDVPPGNHQHMTQEERGAVQEGDSDLVVEHPVGVLPPGHDLAEGAPRHES